MTREDWTLRQEPCRPYAIHVEAFLAGRRAPVQITDILHRLNRSQLERLASAFSGCDPEGFERWLREVTQ